MKSVVVFCSSANAISPMFFSEIELLAKALVEAQFRIVYGGAKVGLMGRLADVALKAGGEVIGVIPEYLDKPHIVHPHLSELIVVDDLLDRKRKMLSLADAAIASPGGIGTLDELSEVLALKQLNEHRKPIILHNQFDFWNPLILYFEELAMRGLISQNLDELFISCDSAKDVVTKLEQSLVKSPDGQVGQVI